MDEAAAACERLEVLAAAVKRAGHPGRLGQIQTDLFLGMLGGRFQGMSETQIITHLLDHPRAEDTRTDIAAATTNGDPAATGANTSAGDTTRTHDSAEPTRSARRPKQGLRTPGRPPVPAWAPSPLPSRRPITPFRRAQ